MERINHKVAENLSPKSKDVIVKGDPVEETWTVLNNDLKSQRVKIGRSFTLADRSEIQKKEITYKELTSGNWYKFEKSELKH
jgi:hypothetical protein